MMPINGIILSSSNLSSWRPVRQLLGQDRVFLQGTRALFSYWTIIIMVKHRVVPVAKTNICRRLGESIRRPEPLESLWELSCSVGCLSSSGICPSPCAERPATARTLWSKSSSGSDTLTRRSIRSFTPILTKWVSFIITFSFHDL